jgi:hypothetical protein
LGGTTVGQLSGIGAATRKRVGAVGSICDGRKWSTRSGRNRRLAGYGGRSILNGSYALLEDGQALFMVTEAVVDLLFEAVHLCVKLMKHVEELVDLILIHCISTVLVCLWRRMF